MRLYKKMFFILTVFIFMICFGSAVNAAEDFLMRIDTVTVPAGTDEIVRVPVHIDAMPDDMNLSCFAWEFYFDCGKLNFITSKNPADFAGELIVNPDDCTVGKIEPIDGSNGKFRFGWSSTGNYITETGIALYLPFYITSDLEPGVYNIVADPFSDIRSGTQSVISSSELYTNISQYLVFGAVVITGEEENAYNDYDDVVLNAKFPTYVPEEDSVVSGYVSEFNSVPVVPGINSETGGNGSSDTDLSKPSDSAVNKTENPGGSGTLVSSENKTKEEKNKTQTVSDSFDAGTYVRYTNDYVIFDTIKSQSGYIICALYKGNLLVGYDIRKTKAGEKILLNVEFSEIPDTAVSVLMRDDGTFDGYGRYLVNSSSE